MAAAILGPSLLAKNPPMTMANGKQPKLSDCFSLLPLIALKSWDPNQVFDFNVWISVVAHVGRHVGQHVAEGVVGANGQVDHDGPKNDQANPSFEAKPGEKPSHGVRGGAAARDGHLGACFNN